MTVRVCADDNQGSYCFRCPECGLGVSKDADERVVELLVSSGVHMDVWHVPAELLEEKAGPALTLDDVLDFHLLLEGDNWFGHLERYVNDRGPR